MNTNIIKPLSTCPRTKGNEYYVVREEQGRRSVFEAAWSVWRNEWIEDRLSDGYFDNVYHDQDLIGWIDLNGEAIEPEIVPMSITSEAQLREIAAGDTIYKDAALDALTHVERGHRVYAIYPETVDADTIAAPDNAH